MEGKHAIKHDVYSALNMWLWLVNPTVIPNAYMFISVHTVLCESKQRRGRGPLGCTCLSCSQVSHGPTEVTRCCHKLSRVGPGHSPR